MDYIVWACKSMHLFSIIVLFGGILFQSGILYPVLKVENLSENNLSIHLEKRFLPFIWSSLWSVFLTGFILKMLSSNFVWFEFKTNWQILILGKEILFLVITFYLIGYNRMYKLLEQEINSENKNQEAISFLFSRMNLFRKINVYLVIIIILISAGV